MSPITERDSTTETPKEAACIPTPGVLASPAALVDDDPGKALRTALAGERILRVGGVHDGLSALVAERCGLDALWASGLGIAASHGVPDANILTMSEVRNAAEVIVRASMLPVVADCDTGFGELRNLRRTVREFELAGVAAICVEDKLYPKRNSFLPGQELADPYEFAIKVQAAKEAQRGSEFMVFARAESLIAGAGMDDALTRAELYVEAGADAIVLHSKQREADEVVEFGREWRDRGRTTPLIAIPTTYNDITAAQLQAAGYSMVIYANQVLRAAVGAMETVMRQIVEQDSSAAIEGEIPSVRSVFDLTGESEVCAYDDWFSAAVERARRQGSLRL